jgi:lipopolysaccharide export system protein LptC
VTAITTAFAPDSGAVPHQPARARAYAKAQRHSSHVRVLKFAIPAGAVVASGLILAAMFYNPFSRMGLTLGPMSISGNKVAMEGPRLTGFKKDARPYEVTALAAYQDIRKPNIIELKDMKARMVMDTLGTAANLVSNTGIFDTQKEHLELSEHIRITTDKGDEALLQTASVDFKGGTVQSKDPVKITTATGQIDAAGVHISDNGKTIVFTGRVHVVLTRGVSGDHANGPSAARYSEAEPAKP